MSTIVLILLVLAAIIAVAAVVLERGRNIWTDLVAGLIIVALVLSFVKIG